MSQYIRFQVLTAACTKMTALWDIAPCSLGIDRRYGGAYFLHHPDDAVRTSKTSVYSNKTTLRYIPQPFLHHESLLLATATRNVIPRLNTPVVYLTLIPTICFT
jgi:hypothetical protein